MVTTKPFADIRKYSDILSESVALFMMGSIFRLESIHRTHDEIWIIRMTLCSDYEHNLKKVLMHMKQQTTDRKTNLRTLGKFLWEIGKVDLAENDLNRFVKELPLNNALLVDLYEDLAKLASLRENYETMAQ